MEMHNALFFGKVVNVEYTVDTNRDMYGEYTYGHHYRSAYRNKPAIVEFNKFVKYQQFYNCNFEKPPLEKGEKVYINELDLTLSVIDRVRSTNGEYCYYVEHIVESINDEKTTKSLEVANDYLKEELVRYHQIQGYEEQIKELKKKKKKKWYHFFK